MRTLEKPNFDIHFSDDEQKKKNSPKITLQSLQASFNNSKKCERHTKKKLNKN